MTMFPKRMADELYHDLMSSETVKGVRREVRAFADEFVAPRAYEIAHRDESIENFPRDVFDAMARHGIFAIPFAQQDGGRGLEHRVLATATVCEELAYHSNSIAAVFDVHCILAGRTLEKGSDAIRERYLKPVIRGEKIGAFATTEPLASTDLSPRAVATIARREGDLYILNGQKRFITNSPVADFIVVLCRSDEDGMVELVVETDQPGVRIGKPDLKMGNRGQLTADVHFDHVEVPIERRIGGVNQGLRVALATLTFGRIGIAATGVGMAQAAFDHSTGHLRNREAFGKKLGAFQHWQFRMAERATQIENARNLYIKAALRMDMGAEFPEPEAAMAKFYATEAAGDMARDGVQIFGGYGFLRELSEDGSHYKVEEIYRDNKISEIYEGTNEIQRMVIARQIFGKGLVG
ncbi:acyl-CoA dehydrogenase family protein [Pseudomonas sp. B26(2017)]|uniref:acyl-CoA dehydrogenase family protein n=1 Tax=Pseudomonas sp. B26(2017) TaxID=1981732 RepID=UPI000A1FC02F|nr:acyl-CoA dehydrogenase family protein [Pseudomonas sp. B26(2017)]